MSRTPESTDERPDLQPDGTTEEGATDEATVPDRSMEDLRADLAVSVAATAATIGLALTLSFALDVRAGTFAKVVPLLAYPGYILAKRVGLPGPLATARTWVAVAVALAVGSLLVAVGA
jgi:hypothetical protein